MSSRPKTYQWVEKLLAVVLFPSLSIGAAYFLFGHLVKTGLIAKLDDSCLPSPALNLPYRLDYTGVSAVDAKICGVVAFFHALMDHSLLPFTTELFASLTTFAIFPYFEAARTGRSTALAFPVLLGILYQCFSLGFIFPWYLLAFIWVGAATFHKRPGSERHTKIDQAHAEAILFGLFVGYLIPTAVMVILEDPFVTAIWQPFPVWMTIATLTHLFFRPSSRYSYSGYNTVQATYIITFILASSYHIGTVWPRFRDVALLKHLFLPSMTFSDPATMTFEQGVHDFIKWDLGGVFTATALATLWFARSAKEVLVLIAWHLVATAIIGPGAALAAVFMWREALLNAQRPAEAVSKGEKDE